MKYSEEILSKAKKIHEGVLTVDSHIDIQLHNFTKKQNYTQQLNTQVNLPLMEVGDLNVTWLVVFTSQGRLDKAGFDFAYKDALRKFRVIHQLCTEFSPGALGLARNYQEALNLSNQGKRVVMIGVENGYPIGNDISRVREFYDLGARYMSFSHNGHSQLCDSHTGEENNDWLHHGLSSFGKQVVGEMNKLGMMIDVSHPSKKSMKDIIACSKAPIIASHSSARAICNHSRNLDDEQLEWIKESGGVIQVVAFNAYLHTEKHRCYKKILDGEIEKLGMKVKSKAGLDRMTIEETLNYRLRYRDLSNQVAPKVREQADPVNIVDFVDHIDYIVHKIGLDYVGISSDFDGGGGIYGWNDASETPNITAELVQRGYTEKEISKLWGGNLFRVMDRVEEVAQEIRTGQSA